MIRHQNSDKIFAAIGIILGVLWQAHWKCEIEEKEWSSEACLAAIRRMQAELPPFNTEFSTSKRRLPCAGWQKILSRPPGPGLAIQTCVWRRCLCSQCSNIQSLPDDLEPSDVTLLSPAGLLINRHLMDPSEITVLLLPTRDIDFVVNLNCSRERLLQSFRHG
jgi:hypothetical protein